MVCLNNFNAKAIHPSCKSLINNVRKSDKNWPLQADVLLWTKHQNGSDWISVWWELNVLCSENVGLANL